ncbi:MAG: Crp/Fnr family transcriptional regulator [Syntrophobacterales bacterium]|jgi:CRP/FNR family transcriptional regulator|nr:Crp/Fnr family transcriptional regulator [Syntrophobacterales bacterium]
MDKIAHFISNVTLFSGLPESQIGELSKIAETSTYKKGEGIFSEGDSADGLYILFTGLVKVYKLSMEGKEQILHIIGPGEPFGEVAVFLGASFPAYAEALEESKTVFFPRTAFVRLITKDPYLAMNMLAVFSQRLKYFTRLIEDLSLKEVPQRFASYLLYGNEETEKTHIQLNITKGQLASLLGTIPETLSRILAKMASENLITVQGRKITVLDRPTLEDIVSGKRSLA